MKIIARIFPQKYRLNYRQDCDLEINRAIRSRNNEYYRKNSTDNQ